MPLPVAQEPLKIVAINTSEQIALRSDGKEIDCSIWFDEDGQRTDDPWEATACLAGSVADGWFPINLEQFFDGDH